MRKVLGILLTLVLVSATSAPAQTDYAKGIEKCGVSERLT